MTRFLRSLAIVAALAGLPAAARTDETGAAKCTAPVAPTGELAAWVSPAPVAAAGSAKGVATAALPVGQAGIVTLLQTPQVKYPLRPEKPGGTVSYGGLIGVSIKQAGTYRVALGSGAWIDVVQGRKAVTSIGHGHGPDCSGIRKMVDFPLEPGRYILLIAANGEPTISVLVARLP